MICNCGKHNLRVNASKEKNLRIDPTHTTVLRQKFVADMVRRFAKLKREIVDAVVNQDVFGLNEPVREVEMLLHADPKGVCRVPAGNPDGGQFSKCGGGGIGTAISTILDSSPGVISDDYAEVEKAQRIIRSKVLQIADEGGFGTELRHWTGWEGAPNVPSPWMPRPSWVPEGVNVNLFGSSRLTRHYIQEGQRANEIPKKFFQKALSGDFGESHQKAAGLIQSLDQGIFERRFGATGDFFRSALSTGNAGDNTSSSVSETSGGAWSATKFKKGSFVVSKVRVKKQDILFSYRTIVSSYPEEKEWIIKSGTFITNISPKQFDFPRSSDKVNAFMRWLTEMEQLHILTTIRRPGRIGQAVEEAWTDTYIESAYKKGILRAGQEMKKAGINIPIPAGELGIDSVALSFNKPVHADRVGLIFTRVYNELKGVTNAMDQQIGRVLAQGLAEGRGPKEIARIIVDRVDSIGINRARAIARTEIVRAHHMGSIQEYKNAGLLGVKVMSEWLTAGFNVCPICNKLQGKIFTIEEIEPMIPAHPNCLLDGQVKVYTSEGRKRIMDIKVGDLVLSHAGKYRKVLQVHRTHDQKPDAVCIHVGGGGHNAQNRKLSVTDNHPILSNGEWVRADQVKIGDSVSILATRCKTCSADIPWFRTCCSLSCNSKSIAKKQWADPERRKNISQKVSATNLLQYASGERDGKATTAAAHKVTRRMAKEGRCPLARQDVREIIRLTTNTPEHRKASSLRMKERNPMNIPEIRLKATQSLNAFLDNNPEKRINSRMAKHRKSGRKTYIEELMAGVLDRVKVDYVFQYPILRYNIDFAIPDLKIAIECDGEHWHKDPEKDEFRQKKIEDEGWTMLRFSGKQIVKQLSQVEDVIRRILLNHDGEMRFVPMQVIQIEHWKTKRKLTLWNLTVDKDESFVANGFVVHNCRCTAIPYLPGISDKRPRATKSDLE